LVTKQRVKQLRPYEDQNAFTKRPAELAHPLSTWV